MTKHYTSTIISLLLLTGVLSACIACSGGSEGSDSTTNSSSPLARISTCGSAGEPLKILPLGDSITEAKVGYSSYRYYLWHALRSAQCTINFVGGRHGVSKGYRDSPSAVPANPDFDQDHEGHWGYTVDQILPHTQDWVRAASPDVVIIHLGSNDLLRGQGVGTTLIELGQVIDTIHAERPQITILLAQIIPANRSLSEIAEFNRQIPQLVESRASKNQPIVVVNLFDGFDANLLLYDGVHPNEEGERRIGEIVAQTLLEQTEKHATEAK